MSINHKYVAPTYSGGHWLPPANNTWDIGSATAAWRNGYFATGLYVDTISEFTSAAGVTIDGVKLKDSQPYCDVINEKTSAAGVTVDGVLLKDGGVVTPILASFYQASGGGLISVPASVGVDVVCLIGATQELDGKTLDSSVLKGTFTASGTVTLPAFTAGGDISLGANKLKTTNFVQREYSTSIWGIYNAAESDFQGLYITALWASSLNMSADGAPLSAVNTDAAYMLLRARDTGVGQVEVARLQGAADPYFQMTLAMRLNPIATASLPATPVEGMLVYDDTANKLKVYNGAAWETVTSA